jgi:integrase
MPRTQRRERVERNLYRVGRVYYACATPRSARQARWRRLGEVGIMDARRMRDEFVAEIRRTLPAPTSGRLTFESIARLWLADEKVRVELDDLAQRTWEIYETGLRLHCLPVFGKRPVRSISADDLVAWHRALRSRGYAADAIHAYWTPLRLVLGHAVRLGLLDGNPADQLARHERPKVSPPRQRFLDRDEIERLLAAARPPYRMAIAVALFGGLRVAEVLGLVWGDVDLADRAIRVRHQMGRDGTRRQLKTLAGRRDVILMDDLARELRELRVASPFSSHGDLVFPSSRGRTLGHRNLTSRGLDKASQRAHISGVTFHALRHTFASILVAQGHDPVFVSRQLGHANPAITLRVYAHLFDAARHADKARQQLDAEYGGILTPAP